MSKEEWWQKETLFLKGKKVFIQLMHADNVELKIMTDQITIFLKTSDTGRDGIMVEM